MNIYLSKLEKLDELVLRLVKSIHVKNPKEVADLFRTAYIHYNQLIEETEINKQEALRKFYVAYYGANLERLYEQWEELK